MLTAYQTRRSKNDRKVLRAAHQLGYKAGLAGQSTTADPYAGRIPHFSEQWLAGHAAAQKDVV